MQLIRIFLSVAGIIISHASVVALNKSLSAFPSPKQNAELIQPGINKYIRHPVYSRILFFAFGYSMCSENTLQLIMFFTLLILSRFKAAYEEELLRDKFPNYAAYKKAAEMFLPEMKL